MKRTFKITCIILIAIIAFLLVTNPTLENFLQYLGATMKSTPVGLTFSRNRNYFVCGTYEAHGEYFEASYFAIAGNFFFIPPSFHRIVIEQGGKVISDRWFPDTVTKK